MNFKQNHFLIGMFFVLLQILVIVRNYSADYFSFFWFCDFAPAIFAFAFFMKNKNLAKAIINIGLFAQIIYLGTNGLNLKHNHNSFFFLFSGLIIHLSTISALFITYNTKPNKKTLFYSVILLCFIFIITFYFTSPVKQINFVHTPFQYFPEFPGYTYLWIPMAFFIVVLPTYGLQHILYKKLART